MKQDLVFVGTGSGWGATNMGTGKAPHVLLNSTNPQSISQSPQIFSTLSPHPAFLKNFHHFDSLIPLFPLNDKSGNLRTDCVRQALVYHYQAIQKVLAQNRFPFSIGGDHSLAMATWSAVQEYYPVFGLIWIDAHLDAHTSVTTPSNAIHGMPAASLLGYGDAVLTDFLKNSFKLQPHNLVYIGARSFETEEKDLLNQLGVKIYFMDEVNTRGFTEVFQEAKNLVTKNTPYYGISLDIDAFDPIEVPGTGTREPDGLKETDVLPDFCNLLNDPHLICFEIVEFNPDLDEGDKTLSFLWRLTKTMLGDSNADTP